MQNLRIFILLLLISTKGISQITDSLFFTYKNQDLRIRQLDFTGSLGAYNNSSNLFNGSTNLFVTNSELLFNGNFALNYAQFVNRSKLQSDWSSNISLGQSRARNYYNSDYPLDNRTTTFINVNNNSRYYPRSEFFYGYGFKVFYGLTYSKKEDFFDPNRIVKTLNNNFNIEAPFSIGKGRKYPVYSVHKCMWIYSQLQENKLLRRDVDVQDIEELAHLIDLNDYTRAFDSRYKRIQDLSRVDSVLQKQNIIYSQNINYFTTLYDMYYYSAGSKRFRGKIVEAGIKGEYYYDHYKLTDSSLTSTTVYKGITPVLFAEYQNYNPLSLHWQFDFGIRAEYGLNALIKNQTNFYGSKDNRISLSGNASFIYYPNTRSYLTLNLNAVYGNKQSQSRNFVSPFAIFDYYYFYNYFFPIYSEFQYNFNYTNGLKSWSTLLQLNYYYYISPQFRTQTIFSLNYSDNNSPYFYRNKLKFNFGITFSYALF